MEETIQEDHGQDEAKARARARMLNASLKPRKVPTIAYVARGGKVYRVVYAPRR